MAQLSAMFMQEAMELERWVEMISLHHRHVQERSHLMFIHSMVSAITAILRGDVHSQGLLWRIPTRFGTSLGSRASFPVQTNCFSLTDPLMLAGLKAASPASLAPDVLLRHGRASTSQTDQKCAGAGGLCAGDRPHVG